MVKVDQKVGNLCTFIFHIKIKCAREYVSIQFEYYYLNFYRPIRYRVMTPSIHRVVYQPPLNKTIEAPELIKMLRKKFQNLTPSSTLASIWNVEVKQEFLLPFPVMERYEKYYKVLLYGKSTHVSIDRLKPAFLCSDDIEHLSSNPSGNNICYTTASNTNPDLIPQYKEATKENAKFLHNMKAKMLVLFSFFPQGRYAPTPTLNISLNLFKSYIN